MKSKIAMLVSIPVAAIFIFTSACNSTKNKPVTAETKRYLYVAVPGIRDYLGYGGHGILVFDIDNDHRFVNLMAKFSSRRQSLQCKRHSSERSTQQYFYQYY
jgi:hypothetical protein